MKPAVVSCRDTPALLLAVPAGLMALLEFGPFKRGEYLKCWQTLSKHVSGFLWMSTGRGHSVFSYLCLRGTSVSRGNSGCLDPGFGTSLGCEHFQTTMSSPEIISLLDIR